MTSDLTAGQGAHNAMNADAPKVLLFVYSCSPYRASEYAVGWGRARQAARFCDTWVICGPESEDDIRRYLAEHGEIPRLHFVFIGRHPLENFIDRKFPASELEHNYLSYRMWHRRAYARAVQLHREIGFSVAHQANTCGYREPGELRHLGVPFVWGPVGGTQNFPWRFLPELRPVSAVREVVRNVINSFQIRYSPRVRSACKRASQLLTANSQGESDFKRIHRMQPILLLETGLHAIEGTQRDRATSTGPLRILWAGRLHPRKGLSLAIRALAHLPAQVQYTLRIVGEGSELERCKALATKLGVSQHCEWKGALPFAEAVQQYEWADVFIFSSLRDTSGNVILEAFSRGVPVICLDHHGARDMVSTESGIKIPVTTPDDVTRRIADAVRVLHDDRSRLGSLSQGALRRAHEYLWDRNGEHMRTVYETQTRRVRRAAGAQFA